MALNPVITDWHQKRVWLIGASTGIGRAVAEALHARGATVIVSARKQAALQEFVDCHPGSMALALDVTDRAATALAAQQLMAAGPLDLVCYCAGHYLPMRATAMDLDELLRHQQVNLTGVLHVMTAVVPAMLKSAKTGRHPHLSLVASVAGFRGLPQGLAYGPTKAALINLAETLFLDLHDSGIGVSVVNPGFVDTPLTAQNNFSMPALITPQKAAVAMLRGWARGDFDIHYPRRFTNVLKLLRLLPYSLYFPLVRRITKL